MRISRSCVIHLMKSMYLLSLFCGFTLQFKPNKSIFGSKESNGRCVKSNQFIDTRRKFQNILFLKNLILLANEKVCSEVIQDAEMIIDKKAFTCNCHSFIDSSHHLLLFIEMKTFRKPYPEVTFITNAATSSLRMTLPLPLFRCIAMYPRRFQKEIN